MGSSTFWSACRRILFAGCLVVYLWLNLASIVLRVTSTHWDDYQGKIGPDVEAQLAHIRTVLHKPGSQALKQPTPVWVVFAHTLYGFTLVNTVLLDPKNQARHVEAVKELKWILEQLKRPEATRGFLPTQVPYGVFYLGERNLTLAGLRLIDPDPDDKDEIEFIRSVQASNRP